jgi:hypothetical protein
MHNTFTYRHSELPSLRPEIKSEIAAIDVQIADLILRCQGNYHELDYLAEILDNCADSCELNLNCIQITIDSTSDSANSEISDLCDLSERSKAVVFSTGMASTVAIDLLCQATGSSRETIAGMIAGLVQAIAGDTSPDEINESIKQLVAKFDDKTLVYQIQREC